MSNLALVSIIFGILIIIGRSPLLFAPEVTLRLIRKIINKKILLRISGIPTALLGIVMITSAWGSDQSAALIIFVPGWVVVFGAILELIFTSFIQRIAKSVWDMDNSKARALGFLSLVFGAFFIYIGLEVF